MMVQITSLLRAEEGIARSSAPVTPSGAQILKRLPAAMEWSQFWGCKRVKQCKVDWTNPNSNRKGFGRWDCLGQLAVFRVAHGWQMVVHVSPLMFSWSFIISGPPYLYDNSWHNVYACMHIYLHTHLHTYIPTFRPSYLPTFLPSCLPAFLPSYLHTYMHTRLPTYSIHILYTYMI